MNGIGILSPYQEMPFFWILHQAQLYVQNGNVTCLGIPEGLQGVLVLAGVLQGHRSCLGPIVIIFWAWTVSS